VRITRPPERGSSGTLWLILLVGAAVGVWLLAQHFRATIVLRAAAAAATIVIPILANQFITGFFTRDDELTKVFLQHLRCYSRRRGIPRVRDIRDLTSLGVTTSRDYRGDASSPYVKRDKDKELAAFLGEYTFVLIIGDSKAGKSRMGANAMRDKFPGRNLIIPDTSDSLPALLEAGLDFANSVIWLDELQLYLEKNGLQRLLDYLAREDSPRDATVLVRQPHLGS